MDEYASPPPPYQLAVNENTWLTSTDLVFVDPVGTGYSYPTKPEYASEFLNPQGDIDSIAEFIRLYLSRYEVNDSPVFIAGESYGTFRAAGLAEPLLDRGVSLRGVILVSPVLNLSVGRGGPLNDLPHLLRLPSYTAAAFAQNKLALELQADFAGALRRSEEWALTDYATALLKGDRLAAEEREQVVTEMALLTGLDKEFITRNNLRVSMDQFARRLLHEKGRVLGHYDSRLSAEAAGRQGMYDPTKDPSLFTNGTSSLIVPYLRNKLGFRSDALYAGPFGGKWPRPKTFRGDWMSVRWDWAQQGPGVADKAASLARAMRMNRLLRILVVSGYYDLATPYFAADYTFSHMNLDPELRENVKLVCYEGGHMVYLDKRTRVQFGKDIAAFVESGLSKPPASKNSNE